MGEIKDRKPILKITVEYTLALRDGSLRSNFHDSYVHRSSETSAFCSWWQVYSNSQGRPHSLSTLSCAWPVLCHTAVDVAAVPSPALKVSQSDAPKSATPNLELAR